jgi:hypothetical protein
LGCGPELVISAAELSWGYGLRLSAGTLGWGSWLRLCAGALRGSEFGLYADAVGRRSGPDICSTAWGWGSGLALSWIGALSFGYGLRLASGEPALDWTLALLDTGSTG